MIEYTNKRIKRSKQDKKLFARLVSFSSWDIRGFTLVETLVAVSILSLSILAGFTAVQGSLKNSSLSKDQIVAFFLAQEAIEVVKNIRDENALISLGGTPTHWLDRLTEDASEPCWFGKVCRVDYLKQTPVYCGMTAGNCPVLSQSISGGTIGLYGYTAGWTATRFKREVQFEDIRPNEVYVKVTITWNMGTLPQTLEVKQLLFNQGG